MRSCYCFLVALFSVCGVGLVEARSTFTERLKSKTTIVLKQDDTIDLLVNGRPSDVEARNVDAHHTVVTEPIVAESTSKTTSPTSKKSHETTPSQSKTTSVSHGKVSYVSGFRVKFFTGGSTRSDKELAKQKGREFKNLFPHVSVYMHFISPHWICTAGDFISQSEAYEFIREVRGSGLFKTSELIVVKSKVKSYN